MEERLGTKQVTAAPDAHSRIPPVSLDDRFKGALLHKLENYTRVQPKLMGASAALEFGKISLANTTKLTRQHAELS